MSAARLPSIGWVLLMKFKICRSLVIAGSGAIALYAYSTFPTAAQDATAIGQSERIVNLVTASLGNRRLERRDPVYASEQIAASAGSHGEIRLNDDTKVLVGENAVVSLDDFVTGGAGFSAGTVRLTRGALRFITGNSPTETFTIDTPVSTIGVRGTFFDVYVDENGTTDIVHFDGALNICQKNTGQCFVEDDPCDIVTVDNANITERGFLRSSLSNLSQENSDFILSANQGRFSIDYRAPTIRCFFRAAAQPGVQDSDTDKRGEPEGREESFDDKEFR